MEYVKLEEICTIVSGGTPSRSKPNYWNNGNIPWIKIKDMKSKYIDSAEEFITEEGLNNSSTKMLKRDTILYSIFATLGEVGILKIDACTNQAIAGLSLKEDSNILKEYLYYYLKSKKKDVNNLGRGVAQNNINLSLLRKFKIPVIPLRQQKKIIEVLDNVSSTINNYERELALLDELVKARFVEMFGDVGMGLFNYQTCKLGDVAKVGSSHRVFTTEFVESGIPFYRGTEIGELANGKKPINPYYISEEHYKRLAEDETKPLIGDLLMPSICNKGQVWMVDSEEPFYYKDGRVLCISPNKEVFNSRFLQYFMREKTLVEYPKIGSGSTFAEFKIFLLKDMDVLVPPLELQNQFASFVQEIDKSRSRIQKSLEASQELFDSLMQEYFG